MSEAARPWYGDGLQFSCTACGKCCKGPRQGYVWVDDDEIRALAEAVGLSLNAFGRRYLHGEHMHPRFAANTAGLLLGFFCVRIKSCSEPLQPFLSAPLGGLPGCLLCCEPPRPDLH